MTTDTSRLRFEALGVLGTGLLHVLCQEVIGYHGAFVAGAVVAWTIYLWRRARQTPGQLEAWGFRRENFRQSFIALTIAGAVGIGGMALIAAQRGHLHWHWHMAVAFTLYPLWGVIQQFLVQALVAANLERLGGRVGHRASVVAICAVAFGVIHAPGREIMLATFLLGLVFTPVYLRWRNLWPLGMYHGWLGLFFYFWVQGKNPVASLLTR